MCKFLVDPKRRLHFLSSPFWFHLDIPTLVRDLEDAEDAIRLQHPPPVLTLQKTAKGMERIENCNEKRLTNISRIEKEKEIQEIDCPQHPN